MDEAAQAAARRTFDMPWNRRNSIRTILASAVSVALMTLLLSL